MHGNHQPPFLPGPALGEHPPHGVALDAELLRVAVRVGVVDHAAFGLERRGAKFFWGKTQVVRQVLDDFTRLFGLDLQTAEPHHPPDYVLPAFRRRSHVRNARHAVLVV